MIPDDDERLIQDVLDGVATEDERTRYAALRRERPEFRARSESLEPLFQVLSRMPAPSMPPQLAQEIQDRVRVAAARGRDAPRRGPVTWLARRPWGLAVPFASGIAVGMIVIAAWLGRGTRAPSPAEMAGTMAPSSPAVASGRLVAGSSTLTMTAWDTPAERLVTLHLASSTGAIVVVGLGRAAAASMRVHASYPQRDRARVGADRVELEAHGDADFLLELGSASRVPLRVRLTATDGSAEGTLLGPPAPSR